MRRKLQNILETARGMHSTESPGYVPKYQSVGWFWQIVGV